MAAPTSTNEVTVRRLSSVITQLWDKIKETFAPKSHTHAPTDINQETYHALTETPVEAQFGVVYGGIDKGNCLMIEVPATSVQYNQGVVVYCTKGNRSAMLMLTWSGMSVRCMHINSDHNDSKWIVKYRKVAMPGQTAETASALLLYIYAQDYSTTNNSSRHRIFSLQNGGGAKLKLSTMAVSNILSGAGDVNHDIIDCADSVSHALTFGSKTYNGSSEQTITASDLGAEPTIGILPYSKGGTNASSQKGAEYNLNVAGATQLTSDASDDLRILFATASPSSSNGIIAGYRKCSQIWSYIKGKLSGSDVNIGGSAKNVAFVKNMYFNTATYALDIKITNVRTAGTTFLIQMCQNNGNVCVLELSLWKGKDSAITGIKAVLLYCSNYGVSELPKDVFYSTSATGDNHVYLASNATTTYSTSFSILYNSEEIAEDRTSSITFGTVERATARGNTQLTVRANGIPRLTGTAVGSSSKPVYVNDYGLLTECGNLNADTIDGWHISTTLGTSSNTVYLL